VDVGKLLQENQALVGAVVGFLVSQAVQVWRDRQGEERAIAAERRADRRAQRDARLARLRRTFEPVLIAAWGIQSASSEYIFSQGDPNVTSAEIFNKATAGINEARAQLMLEENVRDVFDELEKVRIAFGTIRIEVGDKTYGGSTSPNAVMKAQADLRDGVKKIEQLVDEHLRAAERSVI
jgi:hypothetical protein